ncbi:glycosyltransferase family 2 [Fadolivirus algeromassiliense]|jgi:hypothetical protein|uniref:Glycosyltransferase family 2 n=1 Tax=Fadolivirus FV1/VV64 TaxID=3070911 RepID=A0A7D3QUS5_9VIRU|nr:glycosyltransferase family 2 [Fadolivirus algeromassiliense]QKF94407.1 glycosyltransferase family 2 [Fadolivirus FV1/VV64]
MDYKHKYLKYKNKYINLKYIQKGGEYNDNYISIIHEKLYIETNNYPIFTCLYTIDNGYWEYVKKLIESLDKFKLSYYIEGHLTKGRTWNQITKYKPVLLLKVLNKFPNKSVVWVDADSTIEKMPVHFLNIKKDFAVHYIRDNLGSGVIYFKNTSVVKNLLSDWINENNKDLKTWDQEHLENVIKRKYKDYEEILPKEYLAIFDHPDYKDLDNVIVQWQASRQLKRGGFVQNNTISVVIPCIPKHVKYLKENIYHLNRQTLKPNDIIIALSEVSETDAKNLQNELNKISKINIIVLASTEKHTAASNRNRGGLYSQNDIIVFIDADDETFPHKIETVVKNMNKYNADFALHAMNLYGAKNSNNCEILDPDAFAEYEKKYRNYSNGIHTALNICTGHATIRKYILDYVTYDVLQTFGEDAAFIRRLFEKNFKGIFICESLFKYNRDRSSRFN